jgi:predicted RNA binding protein YcfA (HicA-like mRNA interferase family)
VPITTIAAVANFPSLKARALLRVLTREPLGYRVMRRSGSHRRLEASGRPPITFSFHDRQTIRPAMVKRILCDQVGLSEEEALKLL